MGARRNKQSVNVRDVLAGEVPEYFLATWEGFWKGVHNSDMPQVAMLGPDAAELYVRACGARPVFVLGGTYGTTEEVERHFPQICDPIVKSAMALLAAGRHVRTEDLCALVVPVTGLDARKAAQYVATLGVPTLLLEKEPVLEPRMSGRYQTRQDLFLRQLEEVTGQHASRQGLMEAAWAITAAHDAFLQLSHTSMSQLAIDFVRQTYYLSPDIAEWTRQVRSLIRERRAAGEPMGLLLTGSPIYAPNLKLPLILRELGIDRYTNACGVPAPLSYASVLQDSRPPHNLLSRLQELHYQREGGTPAGRILCGPLAETARRGMIFHLLKGELSHAWEAEQLEKAAIASGTPYTCIETSYTNADVEQIRIRLEAFSELLRSTRP